MDRPHLGEYGTESTGSAPERPNINSISRLVHNPDERALDYPEPAPPPSMPLHPSLQPPAPATTDVSRPLDVTDALSYLDAVKNQFHDRPDVYNKFLDIMKDFKGQVIDTPGVIERVSDLFRGHSELIQGFNTFLPPGYRIDVSADPRDANLITVTTPSGTTLQNTSLSHSRIAYQTQPVDIEARPLHAALPLPMQDISRPASPHPPPAYLHSKDPVLGPGGQNSPAPYNQYAVPGPFASSSQDEFQRAIHYVNKIKTRYEDDPDTYKQFLEILQLYRKGQHEDDNQVYSQVQTLFKDAPELLSEFKVFLPTHNGESGSSSVFSKSANYFGGDSRAKSPNEFWRLIDNQDNATKGEPVPSVAVPKRKKRVAEKETAVASPMPSNAKIGQGRTKKTKLTHSNKEPTSPNYNAYTNVPSSPPLPNTIASGFSAPGQTGQSQALPGSAQSQVSDEFAFFERVKKVLEARDCYDDFLKLLDMYTAEIIDTQTLVRMSEPLLTEGDLHAQFKTMVGWDDKEHGPDSGPIGSIRGYPPELDQNGQPMPKENKEGEVERYGPSYRRLPHLETKLACSARDQLCKSVLNDVWVSHPLWASEEAGFVTHKKNQFEEALHKSEEERHEYQIYIDIITSTIALFQPLFDRIVDMNTEQRQSFKLPPDFGGTSKTIYQRTIKKVYGRDGAGNEVLQALSDSPGIAIPVVLQRLKQKCEEWKRAQREWNRVWREVDMRNFYKSLDHQGPAFKVNDKKYITTKNLVTEIENARSEELEKRTKAKLESYSTAALSSGTLPNKYFPSAHLSYDFTDTGVLQDSLKLVFSFLERSSVQYTYTERRSVERMLRSFVPLLFGLNSSFDAVFGPPIEGAQDTDDEVATADEPVPAEDVDDVGSGSRGSRSGRRSAGGGTGTVNGSNGGIPAGDLRKKLLKTAKEKKKRPGAGTTEKMSRSGSIAGSRQASRGVSPAGSDVGGSGANGLVPSGKDKNKDPGTGAKAADSSSQGENDEWTKLVGFDVEMDLDTNAMGAEDRRKMSEDDARLCQEGLVRCRPFFMNTPFYTLLRLLQLLYSRLLLCKERSASLAQQDVFEVNSVALELGLVESSGPGATIAAQVQQIRQQRQQQHGGIEERPEWLYYTYMLEAWEKVFDGEMDQGTFEENMRFLFGTKAYHVFTVDKLIAALIKQVQMVVSDNKCQEVVSLLLQWRGAQAPERRTVREIIRYRREAEQYVGPDDHLYRAEWIPEGQRLEIQLVGSADPSMSRPDASSAGGSGGDGPVAERLSAWRVYVDSYVLRSATEMIGNEVLGRVSKPFLERTREEEEGRAGWRVVREEGLAVGVGLGQCRVSYKGGTEESMFIYRPGENSTANEPRVALRSWRPLLPQAMAKQCPSLFLDTRHSPPPRPASLKHSSSPRRRSRPTSAVLAAIASLAADRAAAATVFLPADFLCPSLSSAQSAPPDSRPGPSSNPQLSRQRRIRSYPTQTLPVSSTLSRRGVPDHYMLSSDGHWYKAPDQATVCPPCSSSSSSSVPSVVDQPADDAVSDDRSTVVSPIATSVNLPPGWASRPDYGVYKASVIAICSLVLAGLIALFIISLVTWRRKKRRIMLAGDEEKNAKHTSRKKAAKRTGARPSTESLDPFDDDCGSILEEKLRAQKRTRAKASARWKANVRWLFRRSRGKRPLSTNPSANTPNQSSVSLAVSIQTRSSASSSAVEAPTLTRQTSVISQRTVRSTSSQNRTLAVDTALSSISISSQPVASTSTAPATYSTPSHVTQLHPTTQLPRHYDDDAPCPTFEDCEHSTVASGALPPAYAYGRRGAATSSPRSRHRFPHMGGHSSVVGASTAASGQRRRNSGKSREVYYETNASTEDAVAEGDEEGEGYGSEGWSEEEDQDHVGGGNSVLHASTLFADAGASGGHGFFGTSGDCADSPVVGSGAAPRSRRRRRRMRPVEGAEPPIAHVAMDDKHVLARMLDMASAPPPDANYPLGPPNNDGPAVLPLPQTSVPEWRDEEYEDFAALDGAGPSTTSPLRPSYSHALSSSSHSAVTSVNSPLVGVLPPLPNIVLSSSVYSPSSHYPDPALDAVYLSMSLPPPLPSSPPPPLSPRTPPPHDFDSKHTHGTDNDLSTSYAHTRTPPPEFSHSSDGSQPPYGYQYNPESEDISQIVPGMGPSAPPFEETADPVVGATAPPLVDLFQQDDVLDLHERDAAPTPSSSSAARPASSVER